MIVIIPYNVMRAQPPCLRYTEHVLPVRIYSGNESSEKHCGFSRQRIEWLHVHEYIPPAGSWKEVNYVMSSDPGSYGVHFERLHRINA